MATSVQVRKVTNCARCGGDHVELRARKMAHPFAPPEAGGLQWTHWAPCPTNGDPILFMVGTPDEDNSIPDAPNGRTLKS